MTAKRKPATFERAFAEAWRVYLLRGVTLGGLAKRFSPSSLVFLGQPVLRSFLKSKHPQVKSLSFLGSIHSSFASKTPTRLQRQTKPYFIHSPVAATPISLASDFRLDSRLAKNILAHAILNCNSGFPLQAEVMPL
jgi:hypothetical protein